MFKKIMILVIITCFISGSISVGTAEEFKKQSNIGQNQESDYHIQWAMNFGSDRNYGARYEGPQPIGDCDNDGDNEILIAGRDATIKVMEWDNEKQTYLDSHLLHPPFYPAVDSDAGGFAIGDLTGDGENEIAATWSATVYKWKDDRYKILGWNNYIFANGGGNGDCYIGDYDNDGKNELIMSGGPFSPDSPVGNIVTFEWNGFRLVKEAEWRNPDDVPYSYVYMAGLGDIDYDGENEIVLGSGFKVWVLDWNKQKNDFDATTIFETDPEEGQYPFACVCKDSNNDGEIEINVGYHTPDANVFKWDGDSYEIIFDIHWAGENSIIEALDVGDVDHDGMPELCIGTNLVHILQWNGETYIEEAVLPTYGWLAVLNIGDCDNDGLNELNAGSVGIDTGQDFMSWTYKYGEETGIYEEKPISTGSIEIKMEKKLFNDELGGGSVSALNKETGIWYDIQPVRSQWGSFSRYFMPTGEYTLRLFAEGYLPQEADITINEGEIFRQTFSLEAKDLQTKIRGLFDNFLINIFNQMFND